MKLLKPKPTKCSKCGTMVEPSTNDKTDIVFYGCGCGNAFYDRKRTKMAKDLRAEIEKIKETVKTSVMEAEALARKQIEKVIEPMLSDLEKTLAKAHETIVTLDENISVTNSTGELTYLKDERFKQSVDFLTKRLGVKSTGSGGTRKGSGKGRPGRKINSALKKAVGKTLTFDDIAKETGVDEETIKHYINVEHSADYSVISKEVTLIKK